MYLDPGSPQRRMGGVELGLDARRVATRDCLADIAHGLPRQALYVRQFDLAAGSPFALRRLASSA